MRAIIYKARRGRADRTQYRAKIIAGNGKKIFVTSESYNNPGDIEKQLLALSPTLPIERL
jgi:uncharacterized protein YegP (UPF0339 family)